MDNQISNQAPSPATQPPSPLATPKQKSSTKWVVIVAIALLVGVGIGYGVGNYTSLHKASTTPVQNNALQTVSLPSDAVQIQTCADNSGTLYVRPKDIPKGPVYMVSEGKVIGVKYMLPKSDLLSGNNFDNLPGANMQINHVNIGLLEKGHLGMTEPHYHVSLYTVDKAVEQGILCAPGTSEESPLMDMKDSDTPDTMSATKAPVISPTMPSDMKMQ